MKHLAAILLIFILGNSFLQGQIAPDFNIPSLDGQNYDLYSKLDEGKIVIIAFFSTQSSASLAYHTSNSLSYLYNSHGPSGDNKVEIYYVEGDPETSQDCIFGNCAGSNNQDWTYNIAFPVFNNHLLAQTFGVTTFPATYIICPDKKMTSVPALSANLLWEKAQDCPVAFGTNNAGIFNFSAGTAYREVCDVLTLAPQFRMTNLGNATLTGATIKIRWNDVVRKQIDWAGFLQKFEYYDIEAGNIAITDEGQLKVTVEIPSNPDQFPSNNEVITQFNPAKKFIDDTLLLKIRTDEFGYETYWEFRDEFENVLQQGGNLFVGPQGGGVIIDAGTQSPGSYPKNTTILKELIVPHNGCFSFHIVDAFGDGLTCSNCGGGSSGGYYKIYNKDNPFNAVITGGAFTSYGRHYFRVESETLSSDIEAPENTSYLELSPNPASTTLNLQFNTFDSQPITIEVYNSLGKKMYSELASGIVAGLNHWSIPVETWPSGSYKVLLSSEKRTFAKQFVHFR